MISSQINERISKLNDKQTLKINDERTLVELFSDFHSFVRADLLNEVTHQAFTHPSIKVAAFSSFLFLFKVNATLIKPIIEELEKSKCP